MGKQRVVFWTCAYNAEKTICRAMESVLNQTCADFTYYCLDNGSSDKTGEIIKSYAEQDSRVVHLSVPENINPGATAIYLPTILSHGDDGYMVWLNADDEYALDFLEKMFGFVTINNLDAAVCGTEYVTSDGTSRLDTPAKTLILVGSGFAEYLTIYYKYITRMWGGLYSLKLVKKMGLPTHDKFSDKGGAFYDVMCSLKAFSESERAGVLADSLHKYYHTPAQLSTKYTPYWFWWVNKAQARLRDFILSFGPISKENENFLHTRFLIWLKYIMPRLQNADVSLEIRMNDLYAIFSDKKVHELLSLDWSAIGIYSDKAEFLRETLDWVLAQAKCDGTNTAPAQKLIDLINGCLDKV